MNKSQFNTKKEHSGGLKRPFEEELNLKMRDTYVSPAIGLKYSHEKLMEQYNKKVIASREERYREVLSKIKERAKPMDHEGMHKFESEYLSKRMKHREDRNEEIKKQVFFSSNLRFMSSTIATTVLRNRKLICE